MLDIPCTYVHRLPGTRCDANQTYHTSIIIAVRTRYCTWCQVPGTGIYHTYQPDARDRYDDGIVITAVYEGISLTVFDVR